MWWTPGWFPGDLISHPLLQISAGRWPEDEALQWVTHPQPDTVIHAGLLFLPSACLQSHLSYRALFSWEQDNQFNVNVVICVLRPRQYKFYTVKKSNAPDVKEHFVSLICWSSGKTPVNKKSTVVLQCAQSTWFTVSVSACHIGIIAAFTHWILYCIVLFYFIVLNVSSRINRQDVCFLTEKKISAYFSHRNIFVIKGRNIMLNNYKQGDYYSFAYSIVRVGLIEVILLFSRIS